MIEIAWKLHFPNADERRARRQKLRMQAPRRPGKRQRGAIAIMFGVMFLVLIGFIGLVFDLAMLYNRRVELQGMADSAALAAARELIGTRAGISNALSKAASTASSFKYQYHTKDVLWSNAAIKFSASDTAPEESWLDSSAAMAAPDGLLFARVDTSALDPDHNTVNAIFMGMLSDTVTTTTILGRATAGRSMIKVTPIGICALSPTPANSRNNPGPPANSELEEFGFRRGVGYDLMNLNPNGSTPENFVINPIDTLGALGFSSNLAPAMVAPFVCSGTMPMPRVMGKTISVGRPFPLASLFDQFNSRFDQYAGALCSPNGAPPDYNVKAYDYTSIPWMSSMPGSPSGQSAMSTSTASVLWTIASPLPAPGGNTAPMYGPLWSFARAVPFSAYSSATPEPTNGYATFAPGSWITLYHPGDPVYTGSASVTPYMASAGANFQAPSAANRPGLRYRRVLNVPLLSCPVGAGANVSATVLAIGKFFMAVPATATSLNAEFAGVVPEQSLGSHVELYP